MSWALKIGEETFTTEKMEGGQVKGTAKVKKCGRVFIHLQRARNGLGH